MTKYYTDITRGIADIIMTNVDQKLGQNQV
jgi:hypothetical protein